MHRKSLLFLAILTSLSFAQLSTQGTFDEGTSGTGGAINENVSLVCENVFGEIPSKYNGFFFGNFVGQNSEVLGRLAVAGDCTLLGGYAISSGLFSEQIRCDEASNDTYLDNLVVGGDLSWQNGRIFSGNIAHGGLLELGAPVSNGVSEQGCQIIEDPNRIDFQFWFEYLWDLSVQLSNLQETSLNVQLAFGTNLEFDITGDLDYEVIELDADELLSATVVNCRNSDQLKENASLIINVRGSQCGFRNVGLQSLQPFASRIVWNFIECVDMVITGVNVPGSVLALNASIVGNNGNIDGQLCGNNFNGSLEFHNVLFNSCLPIGNDTVVPVPGGCCEVICEDGFGEIPSLYNAFLWENFVGLNSEVLGRLAAGGDITLNGGYAVASQLYGQERRCEDLQPGEWPYNLVAGGSLDWQNGRISSGNIVYGDQLNLGDAVRNGVFEQGCNIIQNASLIDFDMWGWYLYQVSQSLLLLNSSNNATLQFGSNLIYGVSESEEQFEVISCSASDLLNARVLQSSNNNDNLNISSNTTIIFNVYGSPCGFQNVGFGSLANYANQIIWNFVDCEQMTLNSVTVPGTILAPNATAEGNNGNLDGHLFALNFNGGLEFHNVPFEGCVYYCKAECEEEGTSTGDLSDTEVDFGTEGDIPL